jgi:hypothetical protein
VARSASPILLALAALAFTGCATTQQTNERYKLRADRTLAGRRPLRVTAPGTDAGVRRVTVLRAAHGGAVVVELRNRTDRVLSDLPITVGVGHRPLNAHGGLNFFQAHVASIAPSGTVAWVFTTRRRIPGGRPFALVGDAARSPATLPAISAKPAAKGAIVSNSTDVPQYGLPVYALARRDGRYVAAARTTLQELGTGSSVTVPLRLIGARHGAPLELEALPTIFK